MLFQIFEADINTGQGKREIPLAGVMRPVSVAVDWIGNNLYVVERAGKRVELISITKPHQRTIIVDYLGDPTDVAVDSVVG